jgi:uncharacterized membrane protein YeaQ/YmgE (transglycosylase-associated protein family)
LLWVVAEVLIMSIVVWVLLGIVAGVVANQLSGKRGVGLVSDALLGIAGAAVAGFAFDMLSGTGEGMSLMGMCLSLLGAGVCLTVSRAIAGPNRLSDPGRTQRTRRVRR